MPAMLIRAVPAIALLTLTACGAMPRHSEDRVMTVSHLAGSAVSVVNANGSVSAEQDERADVRVEVRLFSPSTERLAFATVRAERQGDNALRVWVEWPGGQRRENEGSNIRVFLPDASGVDVRSSNGSVHVAGLSGHAEINTSNGSIVVQHHDGDLHAVTTNASIRAESVLGPSRLDTSNGSIVVADAGGPVEAETSNASASVQLDPSNPGPVRVRTSNGRVELDLGTAFTGRLKLGTSNGSIRVAGFDNARMVESRNDYVELTVGESAEVSAVKTSNGSVRVRGPEPSPSR